MPYRSKLRKSIKVAENSEALSSRLALKLPKLGVFIEKHHRGLTILGTVYRPFSPAWGQHLRIDMMPVDGETSVMIECALPLPWLDFSHENEKTLTEVEDIVLALPPDRAEAARRASA